MQRAGIRVICKVHQHIKLILIQSISAKLGTFSWQGSLTDKLESDNRLFLHLVEHPIPTVHGRKPILLIWKQIRWENDWEADGIRGLEI